MMGIKDLIPSYRKTREKRIDRKKLSEIYGEKREETALTEAEVLRNKKKFSDYSNELEIAAYKRKTSPKIIVFGLIILLYLIQYLQYL